MIEITKCIVCDSSERKTFLSCKDYTVSQETFNISECVNCGFKFTSPRPKDIDLGKYYKSESYVSHSDSKKGIINTLYHYVRNYTLLKKLKLILKYSRPGNIIDYGCGTGAFLEICQKSSWKVFGIEPDSDARKIANERIGINPFMDPEDFIKNNSGLKVDVITLWHVLEHIPDVVSFFKFIDTFLKEKGTLIIAVPNCNSYDAIKFNEYWAAYDLPRHLWHFTPKTISKLFQNNGYKCIETLPMIFESFYVSMLSNKYKTGTPKIISSFLTGLISNFKANKDGQRFSSQIYIFKRI
ncbi:MAG: class I SAM-dependent methyltransferase [Bacteroidota bacterium]